MGKQQDTFEENVRLLAKIGVYGANPSSEDEQGDTQTTYLTEDDINGISVNDIPLGDNEVLLSEDTGDSDTEEVGANRTPSEKDSADDPSGDSIDNEEKNILKHRDTIAKKIISSIRESLSDDEVMDIDAVLKSFDIFRTSLSSGIIEMGKRGADKEFLDAAIKKNRERIRDESNKTIAEIVDIVVDTVFLEIRDDLPTQSLDLAYSVFERAQKSRQDKEKLSKVVMIGRKESRSRLIDFNEHEQETGDEALLTETVRIHIDELVLRTKMDENALKPIMMLYADAYYEVFGFRMDMEQFFKKEIFPEDILDIF